MLLAFVDELRHDYRDNTIIGATRLRGRPALLMETAAAQIAENKQTVEDGSAEESDEESDEDREDSGEQDYS